MRCCSVMLLLALSFLAVPLSAAHSFHANAVAAAGRVEAAEIQPQAVVMLAPTGGETSQTVERYDDGMLRFEQAVSRVTGHEEGGVAVTVSTVTLRNVDILGIVHADEITARVVGRHHPGAEEAEITFEGSRFVNLTVRGVPVQLTDNQEFFREHPTFAALAGRSHRAYLVGAPIQEIPGVGTLILGEVMMKQGQRSLTMLRLDLQTPAESSDGRGPRREPRRRGMIAVALGETNGAQSYP